MVLLPSSRPFSTIREAVATSPWTQPVRSRHRLSRAVMLPVISPATRTTSAVMGPWTVPVVVTVRVPFRSTSPSTRPSTRTTPSPWMVPVKVMPLAITVLSWALGRVGRASKGSSNISPS